ncbi:hypothetical protein C0995_008019 [Termitomyces sp. Mi166|nr:hypothetical protein C0995_008019 [Termitomyces sp. Mi166\
MDSCPRHHTRNFNYILPRSLTLSSPAPVRSSIHERTRRRLLPPPSTPRNWFLPTSTTSASPPPRSHSTAGGPTDRHVITASHEPHVRGLASIIIRALSLASSPHQYLQRLIHELMSTCNDDDL